MWLNLLVGGSPLLTIMATSQNWENIRPNTTIEKTRFYSLWEQQNVALDCIAFFKAKSSRCS